jgi:hypothetical protein
MFNWLKTTFTKKNDSYEPEPLMPRTVNITGVNFHFAMPENFSLDMPGDDLVEKVELKEYSHLPDTRYIGLIKRWWDFYYGPPHAKNVIGTLMLSLDLIPRKKDISGSLFNYETMVNTVYRDISSDFSDPLAVDGIIEGTILPESATSLHEFKVNGRNWVTAGVGLSGRSSTTLNFYSTPISDDWYLRARFLHSKGRGKNNGPLHRRSIGEQMRILESCELEFLTEVPDRRPVEYEIPLGPPLTKEELEESNRVNEKYLSGKL